MSLCGECGQAASCADCNKGDQLFIEVRQAYTAYYAEGGRTRLARVLSEEQRLVKYIINGTTAYSGKAYSTMTCLLSSIEKLSEPSTLIAHFPVVHANVMSFALACWPCAFNLTFTDDRLTSLALIVKLFGQSHRHSLADFFAQVLDENFLWLMLAGGSRVVEELLRCVLAFLHNDFVDHRFIYNGGFQRMIAGLARTKYCSELYFFGLYEYLLCVPLSLSMATLDGRVDWLAEYETFDKLDPKDEEMFAHLHFYRKYMHGRRKLGGLIFKRRVGEAAIALQSLRLPVLQTLAIIDALLPNSATMHYKWQLLAAVKHFRDRRQ